VSDCSSPVPAGTFTVTGFGFDGPESPTVKLPLVYDATAADAGVAAATVTRPAARPAVSSAAILLRSGEAAVP
jgi:hypothetical protein